MKRKIICAALAAAMLLSLAACGTLPPEQSGLPEPVSDVTSPPSSTPSPTPEPSAEPEEFDGTILVSSEFDGLASTYEGYIVLKADALLPTVTIEGRDEAAAAITKALQEKLAASEDNTKDAYDAACEAFDALDDAGREIWLAYGWSSSAEVERGDGAVLSLLCYTYAYTGGAHGSYDYFGQNFSTATGKALSIDDLTDDPEALRAVLTEHILAAAKEDAEELFDVEGFTERVYDTDAWYLTDDALVIFAQVGEVAAGARGRVDFAVPYEELGGLIRAEYLPDGPHSGGSGGLTIDFADEADESEPLASVVVLPASEDAQYLVKCRVTAVAGMGSISLRSSTLAAGDALVLYDTGGEYFWINRLPKGEFIDLSLVFYDTPHYCLVLQDGTALQIAQSGEDGSLLLYEAES